MEDALVSQNSHDELLLPKVSVHDVHGDDDDHSYSCCC